MIAVAYAMDWFLFGIMQAGKPVFFSIVAAGALACRLSILGRQRLRDTGRSVWLMLAIFVPVAGWLLLVRWWCAPSVGDAAPAASHPNARPLAHPRAETTATMPTRGTSGPPTFRVRASSSNVKD